jgi:hypothetical protein
LTPLTHFQNTRLSAAAATEYIRLYVGHAKLRLVALNDLNTVCRMSVAIVQRNDLAATRKNLMLFMGMDSVEAGLDIAWEGDIEIGQDQELLAFYQNTVLNDQLFITVGVELL